MRLLLARHGNTFEAGIEPYVVGRGEDLPLTAAGKAQALALAACLRRNAVLPDLIVCGALQRTRRMGEIIAAELGLPFPTVEDCLTELDYGDWSGLTSAAIKSHFGTAEYEAWETQSIMPANRGWQPDAAQLRQTLADWCESLIDKPAGYTILAITSNGVLRFIPIVLGVADATLPANQLKVKTGHLCGFEHSGKGWKLDLWNADPALLPQLPDKIHI